MVLTAERRNRARLALHSRLRLMRVGDTRAVDTRTENLSSQGFYCISDEAFEAGERLACVLELTTGEGAVRLRCQALVLRVEKTVSPAGFGFACKIEDFRLLFGS